MKLLSGYSRKSDLQQPLYIDVNEVYPRTTYGESENERGRSTLCKTLLTVVFLVSLSLLLMYSCHVVVRSIIHDETVEKEMSRRYDDLAEEILERMEDASSSSSEEEEQEAKEVRVSENFKRVFEELEFDEREFLPRNFRVHDDFVAYVDKFDKEYATHGEFYKGMKNFEKNLARIQQLNEEAGTEMYGLNAMSDWSDEEFKNILMPVSSRGKLREEATWLKRNPPRGPITAYPDHFDWRPKNAVTPVKAQGKCGSCWAFAATATVESAWIIGHPDEPARILSEQTLLDCDLSNNACNGGDDDKAFRFIHREGLAYLSDYPYVAHRQDQCAAVALNNRTKIEVSYLMNPGEESIINWLVNFGPVNIGMSVIQPMRTWKGPDVFYPTVEQCKNEVIGLHAMLVVGYGTSDKGEKYWIIKNSWGKDFGVEGGFIYFARGVNACFIEDEPIGILA